MAEFRISRLVPLNFVDKNRSLDPIYQFKNFDDWKSNEQAVEYQQYPGCGYSQKFQQNDIIFLQVNSTFDPVRVKLVRTDGVVFRNFLMAVVPTSVVNDIYLQAQIALDVIPEGYYKVILEAGSPIQLTLESETIHVKAEHPGTTLIKYSHNLNNNILWETGIYFLLRVEGFPIFDRPISVRTIYIDQPANASTVRGTTYRQFIFYMGQNGGMPNWMADLTEDIFNLKHVELNGKGFSAIPGASLEPKRLERYEWAQWQIPVRETNNSRVKVFEVEGLNDDKVAMTYVVNTKFFGNPDGSSNDNSATITKIT